MVAAWPSSVEQNVKPTTVISYRIHAKSIFIHVKHSTNGTPAAVIMDTVLIIMAVSRTRRKRYPNT